MTLPGTPSLVFLFFLLLFLPWAAVRSARRLEEARRAGHPQLPRRSVWIGTLLTQVVLLMLAVLTGRSFHYPFFPRYTPQPLHLAYALVALALCFACGWAARAIRTEEERRGMNVYAWAPRERREWMLWTAVVLVASVAEELAYRGVGFAILWYSLGNPWIAAAIASVAFAVAHSTQGWKSAAIIFLIALLMHALVALTGTLVLAIVVHAAYDLAMGYRISRDAGRYDVQPAPVIS